MTKLWLLIILSATAVLAACAPTQTITSFDECVAAGNPIMESYPRQCSANGQTFVEQFDDLIEEKPDDTNQTENSSLDSLVGKKFISCPEVRPEVCTLEYVPVCGMRLNGIQCITAPCPSLDAITAGNACGACANPEVIGYYSGSCEDNLLVVCGEQPKNGIDITQFANDNEWICVDICPANYDVYTTQIGIQNCIEHFGIEEISTWDVCTNSSDSCNCVKAYETTDDEPIDNAEYRCVPEHYASRLLFRGGLDQLDENGEQSVAIA